MAIQYPYFFIMKITRNILPNSNMKLDQVCTVKKITWLNRLLLRNIKMRICKMFSWHQKMQFVLCIDATQLALQWGQRLNEVVFYFLKDNIFFSLWNWNKIFNRIRVENLRPLVGPFVLLYYLLFPNWVAAEHTVGWHRNDCSDTTSRQQTDGDTTKWQTHQLRN